LFEHCALVRCGAIWPNLASGVVPESVAKLGPAVVLLLHRPPPGRAPLPVGGSILTSDGPESSIRSPARRKRRKRRCSRRFLLPIGGCAVDRGGQVTALLPGHRRRLPTRRFEFLQRLTSSPMSRISNNVCTLGVGGGWSRRRGSRCLVGGAGRRLSATDLDRVAVSSTLLPDRHAVLGLAFRHHGGSNLPPCQRRGPSRNTQRCPSYRRAISDTKFRDPHLSFISRRPSALLGPHTRSGDAGGRQGAAKRPRSWPAGSHQSILEAYALLHVSNRRGAQVQHEHTEHVAASPDAVYAAISNVANLRGSFPR